MKKRLISLALSAITAISAVSAMSTNAIFQWGNRDNPAFLEKTYDGNALDEKYYPIYESWLDDDSECYISPKGNHLVIVNPLDSIICCKSTLYPDSKAENNKELWVEYNAYISEINKQLKEKFGENISLNNFGEELHLSNRGDYNIKEIIEFLKLYDTLYDMEYQTDRVYFTDVYNDYVTTYADILAVGDITQKVITYVQENFPEAEFYYVDRNNNITDLIENARNVTIKLKDNDSLTAHLDLALEIYETTGISPNGISPAIAAEGSFSNINLDNYLNGDANCDNVQSMADAASIFQAIGNPDKYSLSDLGQFNADYAGDGLTPDDAIAIQKKLAGIAE